MVGAVVMIGLLWLMAAVELVTERENMNDGATDSSVTGVVNKGRVAGTRE